MQKSTLSLFALLLLLCNAQAQHPLQHFTDATDVRYGNNQPVINYTLRIDTALHIFEVDMQLRHVPNTFSIAMFAHPEYDDRYWKYVKDIQVVNNSRATIVRTDSALWRVTTNSNDVLIRYRIQLPATQPGQRAAWRPFLTGTGGLTGGPHSFMYVVGHTLAPSHVTLQLPAGWNIITSLTPTADPNTFFAPATWALMDNPFLIGHLQCSNFMVDGIPHRVAYWARHTAVKFDLTALADNIRSMVVQAAALFGRLPYRDYSFLLQDDAYGSLEHASSVTLGAPVDQLAKGFSGCLEEIAHEYFHSWNLVRIRPTEYGDVTYKTPPLSSGLWWSEGLTILYADLLLRRAQLPAEDSSRIQHLQTLLQRYYNSAGNSKKSPEQVSLAEYGPAGLLGDYTASSHVQGEILGTLFDFIIRNASNGKRSIDNAMRMMMQRFSGEQGFTGKDIEQVMTTVSGVSFRTFFDEHIRSNKPINFNQYLRLLGLQYNINYTAAKNNDSTPAADYRIYIWQGDEATNKRIIITDPTSCWGKAGLHTNDEMVAVNGSVITTAGDFYRAIRNIHIGDVLNIQVRRANGLFTTKVTVSGYLQPEVHITVLPNASEKQRRLLAQWLTGSQLPDF